jgi:hypothetical protein
MSTTNNSKPSGSPATPTPSTGTKTTDFVTPDPPPSGGNGPTGTNKQTRR